MKRKLTTKTIDALPPAQLKRYEVRDERVPGLHIRVSATGAKVWYYGTRVEGIARRIKVGAYPIVSLAEARDTARVIARDVQLGKFQPKTEHEERRVTFGEIIAQFIDLYARPRNRDWLGTKRILGKFDALKSKPLPDIKRADVVRVLDGMVASGTPTRANRALSAVKRLFSWCVDRGVIETSPVAGLKAPAREVVRERVLSNSELKAIWHAADAEGFPFSQFAKLAILTGQRRGEIAGMRWSEIDLPNAVWTIPGHRAKNRSTHVVPLSQLAIQILNSVPRFLRSDLVFTTNGRTAISGFGRLKRRLEDAVGLDAEDWRMHDVRRTVATNMAVMRVAPHVIEAVLNHKTGIVSGVAATYNRHAYLEEKRDALQHWATKLTSLVNTTVDGHDQED